MTFSAHVEVVALIFANPLTVEADRYGSRPAAQHGDARRARGRHSGRGPEPFENLPVDASARLLAVAPHIQVDVRDHRRIDPVAEIDRVCVLQRSEEQPGADQQHQAHRHLEHDERPPPPLGTNPGRDRAAFVAQRRDRVAAQRVEDRRQP